MSQCKSILVYTNQNFYNTNLLLLNPANSEEIKNLKENDKELKNRMLRLLFQVCFINENLYFFQCVTLENELNAINVVKIIEYLFLINPVKDGILESFLQLVEDGYSRFRELALSFLQVVYCIV